MFGKKKFICRFLEKYSSQMGAAKMKKMGLEWGMLH
jgi:hypothetical protein